jgi:hypothetical protein
MASSRSNPKGKPARKPKSKRTLQRYFKLVPGGMPITSTARSLPASQSPTLIYATLEPKRRTLPTQRPTSLPRGPRGNSKAHWLRLAHAQGMKVQAEGLAVWRRENSVYPTQPLREGAWSCVLGIALGEGRRMVLARDCGPCVWNGAGKCDGVRSRQLDAQRFDVVKLNFGFDFPPKIILDSDSFSSSKTNTQLKNGEHPC